MSVRTASLRTLYERLLLNSLNRIADRETKLSSFVASTSAVWIRHKFSTYSTLRISAYSSHLPLIRSRFLALYKSLLPHAVNCRRFWFWRRQSVVFCLCMKYLGNRWTDLYKIHMEDVVCSSLGCVWRSKSKVKVIRDKNGIFCPSGGLSAVYDW